MYLTYSAFCEGHIYVSENQNDSTLFWQNNFHFLQVPLLGDILSKGFYLLNDISANLERKISIL